MNPSLDIVNILVSFLHTFFIKYKIIGLRTTKNPIYLKTGGVRFMLLDAAGQMPFYTI